jgi:uncharacterized protein (TIGR02246 family)
MANRSSSLIWISDLVDSLSISEHKGGIIMKAKSILGFLTGISLVFSLSFAQPANAASDEEEILQVSKTFVKALETNDSKLMNSLYWHSPEISTWGPEGDGAFLSQGWEEEESGTATNESSGTSIVTLHHPQITMLGDDSAFTTVYHQWVTTNKKTQEQTFLYVRQTEVLKKINGKWLLVHVHASILPVK